MINLGSHSGKNLADIYIHPSWKDRILEALILLTLAAVWAVAFFYKEELITYSSFWLTFPIIAVVSTAIFAFSAYAPIRMVNFPFRITDRNQWIQFLLVKRLVRVFAIELNLLFLVNMLGKTGIFNGEGQMIHAILIIIPLSVLAVSFLGYYILAWRFR